MGENKNASMRLEYCIIGRCMHGEGPWCNRCGFNQYEDERRKQLPLIEGEDGISRKYVGIKDVFKG